MISRNPSGKKHCTNQLYYLFNWMDFRVCHFRNCLWLPEGYSLMGCMLGVKWWIFQYKTQHVYHIPAPIEWVSDSKRFRNGSFVHSCMPTTGWPYPVGNEGPSTFNWLVYWGWKLNPHSLRVGPARQARPMVGCWIFTETTPPRLWTTYGIRYPGLVPDLFQGSTGVILQCDSMYKTMHWNNDFGNFHFPRIFQLRPVFWEFVPN